jgi:hypothetical protein
MAALFRASADLSSGLYPGLISAGYFYIRALAESLSNNYSSILFSGSSICG